jgi:hypothetical protein
MARFCFAKTDETLSETRTRVAAFMARVASE